MKSWITNTQVVSIRLPIENTFEAWSNAYLARNLESLITELSPKKPPATPQEALKEINSFSGNPTVGNMSEILRVAGFPTQTIDVPTKYQWLQQLSPEEYLRELLPDAENPLDELQSLTGEQIGVVIKKIAERLGEKSNTIQNTYKDWINAYKQKLAEESRDKIRKEEQQRRENELQQQVTETLRTFQERGTGIQSGQLLRDVWHILQQESGNRLEATPTEFALGYKLLQNKAILPIIGAFMGSEIIAAGYRPGNPRNITDTNVTGNLILVYQILNEDDGYMERPCITYYYI